MFKKLILFACLSFASISADEFDDEFSGSDRGDFFAAYNQSMTRFNDTLYINVLNPVARGYAFVVPKGWRVAIENFFDNLKAPIRFANSLLQFKFAPAFNELKRFSINSTLGFAGLNDLASLHFKIPKSDEDFGQTLGVWGVGAGEHIVLPFFGPSNVRDSLGMVLDFAFNPFGYKLGLKESLALKSAKELNSLSLNGAHYMQLRQQAVGSLYIMLRDGYEQYRKFKLGE